MADRSYPGHLQTLEQIPRKLYVEFSIGSSGAATLVRGKGVKSVAKTGTGIYLITLQDLYSRVLGMTWYVKNSSTVPNAPYVFESADSTLLTTGTFTVSTAAFSGASGAVVVTEPASGNVYRLALDVKNTQVDL